MLGPLATTGMGTPIRKYLGGPEQSTNLGIPKFDGKNAAFLKNSNLTISDEDKLGLFSSYSPIIDFTTNVNLNLSNNFRTTLTAPTTITFTNPDVGQEFFVLIYHDSYNCTFPEEVDWGQSYLDDNLNIWTLYKFICTGSDIYSNPTYIGWIEDFDPVRQIKVATDAATVTFDLATSRKQKVTLTDNRNVEFTNYLEGLIFAVKITQDATGGRLVTWDNTIKWPGGSEPTLTTTPTHSDWFCFICTGSDFDCLGMALDLEP